MICQWLGEGLESEVKGCSFPNSCCYLLILNDSGRSVRLEGDQAEHLAVTHWYFAP